MRLDVTDINELLPPGRIAEAADRSRFISEHMATMPANMLLRRLQSVSKGSDQVAKLLHYRYAQRRLAALAEAGILTRNPVGNVAVPPGAGEPVGVLVAALSALREGLISPSDRLARQQAEALAVAASDLQAEAFKLSYDLTRYGGTGVALSR